jgi:hypothetical protein
MAEETETVKSEYIINFKMNNKYLFFEKKVTKCAFTNKVLIEYNNFSNIETLRRDDGIFEINLNIDNKPYTFPFKEMRLAQGFSDGITKYMLKDIDFDIDSENIAYLRRRKKDDDDVSDSESEDEEEDKEKK